MRVRPQFEATLKAAREIKAHAPHCRVIVTVYEMKRLGREAAELTALADHLTAHGLILEMLAGPLQGMADPSGTERLLFAFFAAMAETERENIRESTLEGLDAAARKGKHGGRPQVITDDMLHTVLRRRANGESVEQIRPDLLIPTGKRKGHNPSLASISGRSSSTPRVRRTSEPSKPPTPTSPPSRLAKFPDLAPPTLTEHHFDYRELLVTSWQLREYRADTGVSAFHQVKSGRLHHSRATARYLRALEGLMDISAATAGTSAPREADSAGVSTDAGTTLNIA